MAKPKEKVAARRLRRSGESIKVIARELGVSASTVSLWCRDIALSKEQIERLEERGRDPFYGKRLRYVKEQQRKRLKKIERLRSEGKVEIGALSQRELFLVGVGLYWAEGFKKDSQVGFANADPRMVRLFVKWLKVCCDVGKENLLFRVSLNESHVDRLEEIENYWARIVGVSMDNFQKSYIQKVQWKKVYENRDDYHGILRVRVRRSIDLLRKIHGWIEGLGGT